MLKVLRAVIYFEFDTIQFESIIQYDASGCIYIQKIYVRYNGTDVQIGFKQLR